ncbi:uncharacterized protein PADG_04006 [Paracoccidioides brasiliensis Pb18]|uniref:Uncharacterized protein n=1 Tax=Paracoccidioides brasiliensis (strain Pb18) TaxID=502780 RepID=C1G9S0_PARBD|nr:uncharacterized protein PADG_04006 [Paracoccidioides brasiliensis Pb18]EEH47922.1 hypothetical protein PADG_04006 [Paracoccidioides brasiliensis Pb18]
MSEKRSNSPPSTAPALPPGRRASIASGTSFSELFSRPANAAPQQPPPSPSINIPGSIISSASAQAQQRRRMSITTLGLSGSPTQSSPFSSAKAMRRESVSSSVLSGSPNMEDSVIEENENDTPMTSPSTPFARRLSFGAQAFRERVGGGCSNGRYPSGNPALARKRALSTANSTSFLAFPTDVAAASTSTNNPQNNKSNSSFWRSVGEGFNWPEALRSRAERAPSLGVFPPTSPTLTQGSPPSPSSTYSQHHRRAASVATMEQPTTLPPESAQKLKQQPKQRPKPDYFQEKILRGDFMD